MRICMFSYIKFVRSHQKTFIFKFLFTNKSRKYPHLALNGYIYHFKNLTSDKKTFYYVCKNSRNSQKCKGMITFSSNQTVTRQVGHSCKGYIENEMIVSIIISIFFIYRWLFNFFFIDQNKVSRTKRKSTKKILKNY